MLWFEGEIAEAINLSKALKSLFIVLVEGEANGDEEESVWNDENINTISESNKCVCLKLKASSQLGSQFSQIYPVIIYPTVYFIGNNGQPLEVKVGKTAVEELIQCFNRALELHKGQQSVEKSNNAVDVPPSSDEVEKEETGDVGESSATSTTSSDDRSKLTLEERTELAKQQITELNASKSQKLEEEENQKEMERRKVGQDMKKLKDFKEDTEKKELEREFKKQKEEDLKARERIRREIELDREERAKKYYKEKEDDLEKLKKVEVAKEIAQQEKEKSENAAKLEHARIQFKLPDGSNINNIFEASDLLSSARSFILQNLREKHSGSCTDVTLSTIHPKKTFDAEDYDRSFLELKLVPSSVVIVLPKKSATVESNSGENILFYIFAQLVLLYHYLVSLIFPANRTLPESDAVSNNEASSSQAPQNYRGARSKVFDDPDQGLRRRKEGNIHRLTADDKDDEQATWNGNSTQQM